MKTGMIYFAIPEDGKGPSFGPTFNKKAAERNAAAMPGNVVGINVDYIARNDDKEDDDA